jgi:hypothetical protein
MNKLRLFLICVLISVIVNVYSQSNKRNLIRCITDSLYGYIDSATMKIVIPCKYKYANPFTNGVAGVGDKGKVGLIDEYGNEVTKFKYEAISLFHNGLAKTFVDKKTGVIDKTGKEIVTPLYDRILFDENLILVLSGNRWGVMERSGKELVPPTYDHIQWFSEGLATVEKDEMTGYINEAGKLVIPLKFTSHYDSRRRSFSEGFCKVAKRSYYYGFIDKSGNEVIPFKYWDAEPFKEGFALVKTKNDYIFINKKGKNTFDLKFNEAYSFENGQAIVSDVHWGIIDLTGKLIVPYKYMRIDGPVEGMYKVSIWNDKEKWGFLDNTGNEVVSCKFDKAEYFSEDVAAICLDHKWGFIDKTGKLVIPLKYASAGSFENGLAPVSINNKSGYINHHGDYVISPVYDYAYGFKDGFGIVKKDNKEGMVDTDGNLVLEVKYKSIGPDFTQKNVVYIYNKDTGGFIKTVMSLMSDW